MSVRKEFDRGGGWIPWSTGILIVVLYLAARFFPGYWTWPFNAVAYLPPAAGIALLAALLAILAAVTVYRGRLAAFSPPAHLQGVILVLAAALGILAFSGASAYIPGLDGDGWIDHHVGGLRLRQILAQAVGGLPGFDERTAIFAVWRLAGAAYLLVALILVWCAVRDFWSRVCGLLLFLVLPSVVNFTGHYDSYAVTLAVVSAFLACLYLSAARRSGWALFVAIALFYPLLLAHPAAVVALAYPLFWCWIRLLRRGGRRGRAWISLAWGIPIAAAGGFLLVRGFSEWGYYPLGRWFAILVRSDGTLRALAQPFPILAAFLLPFGWSVILSLRPFREAGEGGGDGTGAAAWTASLVLFFFACLGGILEPVFGYGVHDSLSPSGTLGALFAVPLFVILRDRLRPYLYCPVILSAFITLPILLLQSGPDSVRRLRDTMAEDRGMYLMLVSPYFDVGRRMMGLSESEANPDLPVLAISVLEQGGREAGYYRRFAPVNLWQAALYRYRLGDWAGGDRDLAVLLRDWPRTSCLLLTRNLYDLMDGHPGERERRKAGELCAALAAETGRSIYTDLILRLAVPPERPVQPPSFLEYRAAIFVLSHRDAPETVRPEPEVENLGTAALAALGLADLGANSD